MRLTAFFHPLATLATVTLLAALTLAGCGSTIPARSDAGTQPALSSSAPPVRIGIALGKGKCRREQRGGNHERKLGHKRFGWFVDDASAITLRNYQPVKLQCH